MSDQRITGFKIYMFVCLGTVSLIGYPIVDGIADEITMSAAYVQIQSFLVDGIYKYKHFHINKTYRFTA